MCFLKNINNKTNVPGSGVSPISDGKDQCCLQGLTFRRAGSLRSSCVCFVLRWSYPLQRVLTEYERILLNRVCYTNLYTRSILQQGYVVSSGETLVDNNYAKSPPNLSSRDFLKSYLELSSSKNSSSFQSLWPTRPWSLGPINYVYQDVYLYRSVAQTSLSLATTSQPTLPTWCQLLDACHYSRQNIYGLSRQLSECAWYDTGITEYVQRPPILMPKISWISFWPSSLVLDADCRAIFMGFVERGPAVSVHNWAFYKSSCVNVAQSNSNSAYWWYHIRFIFCGVMRWLYHCGELCLLSEHAFY